MPSYEVIGGENKIQIVRSKDDKSKHKTFEDARKAAIQELDACLTKSPPSNG
jgi:hypothetical protein